MSAFRVIIVEDDPMVTEVNRAYVEQVDSFRVVSAAGSGREGIRQISELHPDLVILDVYLPDLGGVDVLKEIRRLELPTDVIMVTAAHDAKTVQEVLRQGAIDYIIKPFKFDRIRATLHSYATMRQRLSASPSLSQEEVDRLLGGAPPSQPEQTTDGGLPKGLTDWTLRQVLLFMVNQNRPVSSAEVGDGVRLARVTVRRYLDYLVQQGQLRVEQHYGPVGRPVYRYRMR